jgi:hypothetical protein
MQRLTSTGGDLVLLALGLAALAGCGSSSDAASCEAPTSPAAFELGTGDTCFERLTPGQTITVFAGPQGGYHVWTSLGCSDCPAKTILEYGVKTADTRAWINDAPVKLVATLGPGPWAQQAGLRSFLPGDSFSDKEANARPPVGLHVLLTMRALDAGNAEIHAAEIPLVLGETEELPAACPDCN